MRQHAFQHVIHTYDRPLISCAVYSAIGNSTSGYRRRLNALKRSNRPQAQSRMPPKIVHGECLDIPSPMPRTPNKTAANPLPAIFERKPIRSTLTLTASKMVQLGQVI